MTDLQFNAYVELRNKYDALAQELNELRWAGQRRAEEGGEYLFTRYEEMRDKCEEFAREVAALREENSKLKMRLGMSKAFQKGNKR